MTRWLSSTALALSLSLAGTAALAQQGGSQQRSAQSGSTQSAAQCPDHFAALDADKDNRISQKEVNAVRDKVFESLDQNNDNMVSRDEYVNCLTSTPAFRSASGGSGAVAAPRAGGGPQAQNQQQGSLLGISERRMEQNFKQVDANNDGRITWTEYMNAAKAEHAKSKQASGQSDGAAAASAGWAFARMDSNVDGELTMQEWTDLSDPKTVAEASFKAIDQNGDGQVTKQEYQAYVEKRSNQSAQAGRSGQQASRTGQQGQSSQQAQDQNGVDIWDYEFWM